MGEHVSRIITFTLSRLTLCSPGYIAGVTNPIFEAAGVWDLLCDIGTNRMVVHKDIYANHPATWNPASNQLIIRAGTLKAESSVGSEEEVVRVPTKEGAAPQKPEVAAKQDHPDNIFIEDVRAFWHVVFTSLLVMLILIPPGLTGPRRDCVALLGGPYPCEVCRVHDAIRARRIAVRGGDHGLDEYWIPFARVLGAAGGEATLRQRGVLLGRRGVGARYRCQCRTDRGLAKNGVLPASTDGKLRSASYVPPLCRCSKKRLGL